MFDLTAAECCSSVDVWKYLCAGTPSAQCICFQAGSSGRQLGSGVNSVYAYVHGQCKPAQECAFERRSSLGTAPSILTSIDFATTASRPFDVPTCNDKTRRRRRRTNNDMQRRHDASMRSSDDGKRASPTLGQGRSYLALTVSSPAAGSSGECERQQLAAAMFVAGG